VTLENLINGEKNRITVSGPAEGEQKEVKALAERLARDALYGAGTSTSGKDGKVEDLKDLNFSGFQGIGIPPTQTFLLSKDYVYSLPGYTKYGGGVVAEMPGFAPDFSNSLIAENSKLKELIKLQEGQIKLLQDELVALQGKLK
jgi:hypothetical protein